MYSHDVTISQIHQPCTKTYVLYDTRTLYIVRGISFGKNFKQCPYQDIFCLSKLWSDIQCNVFTPSWLLLLLLVLLLLFLCIVIFNFGCTFCAFGLSPSVPSGCCSTSGEFNELRWFYRGLEGFVCCAAQLWEETVHREMAIKQSVEKSIQ